MAYDYIVVGAGSSGCVVAARLSEDPAVRVLLIEAGEPPRSPWIGIPAGLPRLLGKSRYNWGDMSAREAGLQNRRLPQLHGRTLGGSGAINGMVFNEGHPEDFDGWRDLGNKGWGWSDLAPCLARVEQTVATSLTGLEHPSIDAFLTAAQTVGLCTDRPYATSRETGAGRLRLTIANGRRNSPYDAYLRPVRRPNLDIVTGAEVRRILLRDGRAVGVEWQHAGRIEEARQTGEIVLCAGAVDSPRVLMLSGIGDPRHLQDNGIAPVVDSPGVGRELADHPLFGVTADTDPVMSVNHAIRPVRHPLIGLEWLLARRGLATVGGSLAGAFAACLPGSTRPDVQINFRPFSTRLNKRGAVVVADRPQIHANVALLRPLSRGDVRLKGPDPATRPVIAPGYLSDPADLAGLAAGVRLLAKILRAQPLGRSISSPALPGDPDQSDADLHDQIRRQTQSMAHPVGTCRMGQDPMAVVDERLRVRGVTGLRVADCSIMPAITAGNTNVPAMMIGEKAAEMIREDRARA